jgi:uncharacterized protein
MEQTKIYPKIGNALLLTLLALAFQILGGIILAAAGGMTGPGVGNWTLAAINIVSLGLVILIGYKKTGAPFMEVFPLKKISPAVIISILMTSFGFTIILSEVDNLFRTIFPMPDFMKNFITGLYASSDIIGSLFVLGIVAPLTEEFMFRGVFMRGFMKNYRPITAILVSSVIFSLIHMNPWQMLSAFTMGIYLAVLLVRTGSLVSCLLAHSFFNFIPVLFLNIMRLEVRGYTAGDLAQAGRFQPPWFDAAGILLVAAGIYIMYRSSARPVEGPDQETNRGDHHV